MIGKSRMKALSQTDMQFTYRVLMMVMETTLLQENPYSLLSSGSIIKGGMNHE